MNCHSGWPPSTSPQSIPVRWNAPLKRRSRWLKRAACGFTRSADLGEVKFGEWQGQTLKALSNKKEWKIVQAAPSAFQFPGGESFRETQSRAVGAIEKIVAAHAKDTVAAFSHGDVIKLIVAYYSGIALDNFQRIAISPASINVIELGPFGARLGRLNDTGPLQNHHHPKK